MTDIDDLIARYRALTKQAATLRAVLSATELQRAVTVAHMHHTGGLTLQQITDLLGDRHKSRIGQLVIKGRPHLASAPAKEATS